MTNKELKDKIQQSFLHERIDTQRQNKYPLHLYSFRVYCAHNNIWRLIDRRFLKPDEINIMNKLGIYKPSRTEQGIPRYHSIGIQSC
jgi:hypothetical protein